MENKTTLKEIIISIVLSLILLVGAYMIVMYEPSVKMDSVVDVNIDSSIVSADPSETTYKFIRANGTMGNVEKDITQDKMKTNEAVFENSHRRLLALSKVKDAIIPGSPLIRGDEEGHIKIFTRDLDSPYIYSVSNIEVSKPSKPLKLTVFSDVGPTDYNSVEVFVSFDSTRINYVCAKDTSYDGTNIQKSNTERFEKLKVTLVQIADVWLVYDIEDAEQLLNERFATWSGTFPSTIDYSKSVETGTFKIEGIKPFNDY